MGHGFSLKTYMRSRTCWALAATMLAMLCMLGCSSRSDALNDPPKALSLQPVMATHPVYFDNGSANLTPAEMGELRAFLGGDRYSKIDSVTVYAGGSQLGAARAARVSDALSNLGYTHVIAQADQSSGSNGDDSVAVAVKRLAAVPPACPDWVPFGNFDPQNLPMKNLGCSNATNLYLMVADPRDLVSGRMLGPGDGDFNDRQIDNYRTGKDDNLSWGPSSSTTGGGGSGGQ